MCVHNEDGVEDTFWEITHYKVVLLVSIIQRNLCNTQLPFFLNYSDSVSPCFTVFRWIHTWWTCFHMMEMSWRWVGWTIQLLSWSLSEHILVELGVADVVLATNWTGLLRRIDPTLFLPGFSLGGKLCAAAANPSASQLSCADNEQSSQGASSSWWLLIWWKLFVIWNWLLNDISIWLEGIIWEFWILVFLGIACDWQYPLGLRCRRLYPGVSYLGWA